MMNCFRNFVHDLTHMVMNIPKLLKKDNVFVWSDPCYHEFLEVKKCLSEALVHQPFVKGWETQLYIDYSSLDMELVFAEQNLSNHEERCRVWCDSTKHTDAQTRYSSIYGEYPAMLWAILKCSF